MHKCRFEFIRTRTVSRRRIRRVKSALTGCAFFCGFVFFRTMLAGRWVCCPNEFEPTVFGVGACR